MSDLFLAAMCAVVCVENTCVLIIINTTLASCGADCHRHGECEVTQKPDCCPYYLVYGKTTME